MRDRRFDDSTTVQIATAPNELVADMWRQALVDAGIVAVVKPGGLGYAWASTALLEHLIFVREDQAELAREVIRDLEADADDEPSSDSES